MLLNTFRNTLCPHDAEDNSSMAFSYALIIKYVVFYSQLSHPHLLLLMAVSMSTDLNHTRLVYERVNVGSLFSLLHQRVIFCHFNKHTLLNDLNVCLTLCSFCFSQREEFPLLQVIDLLSVVLQVCEVLMYLHGRTLVLRALSSHTILIVHPGVAKVTGLGFMVPRYIPAKDILQNIGL